MMEESHDDDHDQYLMWMKRKQVLKSHIQPIIFGDHHHHHGNYNNKNNYNYNYYYYSSSTSSSWEERAFAEDAARILGAAAGGSTLTWPPRSYSCTFCNREFRSAQALGGHMNVHRRDRARLKQNLIISPHHQESLEFDHHHHKNDYNSLSLGENYGQQEQDAMISTPYSSSSSSIIWGHKKIGSPSNNSEHGATEEETKRGKENIIKNKGLLHCSVETDLTVGLISSSMFGQNSSPSCIIGDGNDDEEAIISCKRLKTNTLISSSSSLPLMKQCSKDKRGLLAFQLAEKVIGTMEDLDLELRLGKQQKVN